METRHVPQGARFVLKFLHQLSGAAICVYDLHSKTAKSCPVVDGEDSTLNRLRFFWPRLMIHRECPGRFIVGFER